MIGDSLDADGALQMGLEAIFFNENRLENRRPHQASESFIRIKKIFIIMKKHLVFIY
jgi:FMN phosphatase YigB (HAD superfamily)